MPVRLSCLITYRRPLRHANKFRQCHSCNISQIGNEKCVCINRKLLREAADNELEVLREIFALRRSGSCLTSQMKISHDKNMEAIRKSFDRKDADTLYKARIKTSQVPMNLTIHASIQLNVCKHNNRSQIKIMRKFCVGLWCRSSVMQKSVNCANESIFWRRKSRKRFCQL